MIITILNGSLVGDNATGVICESLRALPAFKGAEFRQFDLATMDIKPCRGCFSCWIATPGLCPQRDAMEEIYPHLVHSDLQILVTPIVFGGYSYDMKKCLDRIIPTILPFFRETHGETHHYERYDKRSKCWFVGIQSTPDDETAGIFRNLAARNAINMDDPTYKVAVVSADRPSDEIRATIMALGA